MLHALSVCAFFAAAGGFVIYRGKAAIANKFIRNSRKSYRYTGVTHMEGAAAVRAGKVLVVMGWIMMVGGIVGSLAVVAVGIAQSMSPEHRELARFQRQFNQKKQEADDFLDQINAELRTAQREGKTITATTPPARKISGQGGGTKENDKQQKENPAFAVKEFNNPSTNQEDANPGNDDNDDESDRNFLRQTFGNRGQTGNRGQRGRFELGHAAGRPKPDPNTSQFGSSNPEPGTPSIAFPLVSYNPQNTHRSAQLGFSLTDGEEVDKVREGCVLVGMIVGQGEMFNGSVQNVQPIYQRGAEYSLGNVLGSPGGRKSMLLAPAGFAVSGLQVRSGVHVMAIRLAYMKLAENARLVRNTQQASNWVGVSLGSEETADGKGQAIVSVFAATNRDSLAAVGLISVDRLTVTEPATQPVQTSNIRTWTSRDGSYTLQAEYVNQSGGQVILRKADGSEIPVDITKLTDADRDWLRERD